MFYNPGRFSIARRRAMLTKKAIAEALGVAPLTVTRWEKGQEPSEEYWLGLEQKLGYPKAFFFGEDLDEPTEASFRSLKSLTAARRDAALSAGVVGFLLSDWIDERFNLPSSQVPDLGYYSPEKAAVALRQEWALGERPVSNMLQLLESKGVRVFSLSENTRAVDAYSIWRNGTPYVFLNNQKSAERGRFDAAHEVGHLVLHQDQKPTGQKAEDEANQFASSFLMPAADVNASLPYVTGVCDFLRAKKRWKVSLAAIIYRSHKLGLISDWRYRDFSIEISKRGWNRNEPDPIPREQSVMWEKVLKMLWADRITLSKVAAELCVPERELNDLVFGLTGGEKMRVSGDRSLRSI
jgi:Zn-dependent peptidase ImmA (M78 family)/DNA-binding XRE family transcriptional regulator